MRDVDEIEFTITAKGGCVVVSLNGVFHSWQHAYAHPLQALMNALSSAARAAKEPEPMDLLMFLMFIGGGLQHDPYEFVSLRGRLHP